MTLQQLEKAVFNYHNNAYIDKKYSPYRVSSLGKPCVLQALGKFGYVEPITPQTEFIFAMGRVFEAKILEFLKKEGVVILGEEVVVEYDGIKGHADFLSEDFVGEIKTMSGTYFDKFVRKPDDERGYLTQLAIYSHCLDKPGVFICFNKLNQRIELVRLSEKDKAAALKRVDSILPVLKALDSPKDLFYRLVVPPPVPEVFRKRETDRLLLHPSMRYSAFRDVFYVTTMENNGYNKKTEYFLEYRKPQEAYEYLLTRKTQP